MEALAAPGDEVYGQPLARADDGSIRESPSSPGKAANDISTL
jgi:hypothetical protein